jgi:ATP-binding cassette subfamily B protein
MTLRDNIEISDNDSDDASIYRNAALADIQLDDTETFPQNIDTMLSRDFDGVDLSGGQWQRVALARGLYRNHNLIILDEPTAAIDPIEETLLFNRFVSLTQDKTALLVTHRLGSTRIADRIIVLHDGQIVEEGTHDELRSMNGVYEQMYKAQSEWYMREETVPLTHKP